MNKLNEIESIEFMSDILYKQTTIERCKFVYRSKEVYLEEINDSKLTIDRKTKPNSDSFKQQLVELNLKEHDVVNILRYIFTSFVSWTSQGEYAPFLCNNDFSFTFDRKDYEKKKVDFKLSYKLMLGFFILFIIYGLARL